MACEKCEDYDVCSECGVVYNPYVSMGSCPICKLQAALDEVKEHQQRRLRKQPIK